MAGKSRKRTGKKNHDDSKGAKKCKLDSENEGNVEKNDCETKAKFQEKIKELLKMEMPDDFFEFYEFCKNISSLSPSDALTESLGLKLCGPYDILNGDLPEQNNDEKNGNDGKQNLKYHLNSRFYYDPPEVMTLVRESTYKTGFHFGYFRDSPNELPSLVVTNSSENNCTFKQCGDNIFAAVSNYSQDLLKSTKDKSKQRLIKNVVEKLKNSAKQCHHSLELVTSKTQTRSKKLVTKTFHKMGLVVPLDQNEVGYRPLNVTDNALRRLLTKICESKTESEKNKNFDELHELVTLVQFANDECDYGMGLELGIDLFCFGSEVFRGPILQLLPLAYSLLGRDIYGEIVEKHLENRARRYIDMNAEEA